MWRDFAFFLTEALISMRRSLLMMVISVATITVSMLVFGFFLLISLNLNFLSDFIANQLEIRVYVRQEITRPEIRNFQNQIAQLPQVKGVEFVDRADAWAMMQKNYPNMELSDVLDENPLPHALRVYLSDTAHIEALAQRLKSYKEQVDDVVYGGEIAHRIQVLADYTRWGGIVLVTLLSVATLLIVVNTIRLTVMARQNEISIMHLVGATHAFIRWPFIFEGLILGLIGSGIAVLILRYAYLFLRAQLKISAPYFPIISDASTVGLIYLGVGAMGAFLGIVGAYISVSGSLRRSM